MGDVWVGERVQSTPPSVHVCFMSSIRLAARASEVIVRAPVASRTGSESSKVQHASQVESGR